MEPEIIFESEDLIVLNKNDNWMNHIGQGMVRGTAKPCR